MWQMFVSYMYTFSLTFRPRAASNDSHVPVPGEVAYNDQAQAKMRDSNTLVSKIAKQLVWCREYAIETRYISITVVVLSSFMAFGGTVMMVVLAPL